jgi:hypothetical protein
VPFFGLKRGGGGVHWEELTCALLKFMFINLKKAQVPQIVASRGTKYNSDFSQKAGSVLPVGQHGLSLWQCLSENLCPFRFIKRGGGAVTL